MAAAVPAGPPPTTSTSVSAKTATSRAGSEMVLAGRGRRALLRSPNSSMPWAAPILLE
jgi:hypothetical protein